MEKVLYCLIIFTLLFISCKNTGNESANNEQGTTTAVEGSWRNILNSSSGSTTTTITFTGSNFTMAATGQGDYEDPNSTDPNNPTIIGTAA